MQKITLWLVVFLFFCSTRAMNEKSLWVQTTDTKKCLINSDIIASSNLLTVLYKEYYKKHNDSKTNPLNIPITNELLQFYCLYSGIPAKNLWTDLKSNSYFKLIDAAEKLKARKIYIDLVTEILPQENESEESYNTLHGNITKKWISHLLIRAMINKQNTSYTFPTKTMSSSIILRNNDTHLIHNFCNQVDSPHLQLYNIKTKKNESLHPSFDNQRVYCSPNNNYIVIVDLFKGIYIYDIPTKNKSFLYQPYNQESDIIISDNSAYILSQQLLPFNDHKIIYKLWNVDDNGIPKEIDLNNNLSESKSAIFHSDNKNIFHLNKGKLYLYNIATGMNTQLNPKGIRYHPKNFEFYDNLVMSSDKNHILCKMKNSRNTSLSDHINYVVFNIENTEKITFTILPPIYKKHVIPLCIPHTELIAYCADNMEILQILNEKQMLVASHAREKNFISTLASDKYGRYLACGYSNGCILLGNTSDLQNKNFGTKLIGLNVPIKHLTFTNNDLLLSHAKPELFAPNKNSGYTSLWDTQGNYIINFGSSVVDARINENGSFITIIKSNTQPRNIAKTLELTCYDIHQPLLALTLKQAHTILQKK